MWQPASALNEVFQSCCASFTAALGAGGDSQECLGRLVHHGGLPPNHLLVPRGEARSRPSNGRLVVLLVGQVLTHASHLTPWQLVLFAGDTTAQTQKRARLDPTTLYLTPQPDTPANNRCDLIYGAGQNNSFHFVLKTEIVWPRLSVNHPPDT